jgi:hypothetical protein
MNPVQAIGVFHDAKGSIPANVAPWLTIMIRRPAAIT